MLAIGEKSLQIHRLRIPRAAMIFDNQIESDTFDFDDRQVRSAFEKFESHLDLRPGTSGDASVFANGTESLLDVVCPTPAAKRWRQTERPDRTRDISALHCFKQRV